MKHEDVNHILDIISKEMHDLDKQKAELNKALNYYIKIKYNQQPFKCPIGLSNKDAICLQCVAVLPDKNGCSPLSNKGFMGMYYKYPEGYNKKYEDNSKTEGCQEWKKKQRPTVCGCGGKVFCECGYVENFCFHSDSTGVCPFCGRKLKAEFHKSIACVEIKEEKSNDENK